MKFQDPSVHVSNVKVGIKSMTNGQAKSNMAHQLFQSWEHNDDVSS